MSKMFNGHAIQGTPIAVDFWKPEKCPNARLFFLTHFHSDHMVGLRKNWSLPLFTSPVTSKLLTRITGVNPSVITELEVDEDYLIPLDGDNNETVTVRAIDSNHCPGSVMFLFQGYFGSILYTGDFRYKSDMDLSFLPQIDILFLDNTYCSPRCDFNSEERCFDSVLQQVHSCLKESKRIFIGIDNLGKEELLMKIAEENKTKICVSSERMKTLQVLELEDIATLENSSSTTVFAVPVSKISGQNVINWCKEMTTCAILPTARYSGLSSEPFQNSDRVHLIPYSNHSSYKELTEFVKLVKPGHILPIVKKCTGMFGTDISDRSDMTQFSEYMMKTAPPQCNVPISVQNNLNRKQNIISRRKSFVKQILTRPKKLGITFEDQQENSHSDISVSSNLKSIDPKRKKTM